ncbi:hypothetical protein A3J19_01210 [Candidatus Daviesbacteria bacterium RIFCSPLOWO2_02_FULL_41_8]|uniref:Uncharacterized protein n=3 Tax=Patescibacteria group TaxID=1783273 RepID=A0A1F5NKD3_9BACT|nr:MAG: hypothetical protein A2871_02930 [Candidatus Daviesbacteria bacterium RIFCSPHIGHO2_01_FULL_41_23]OGE78078.1 MAG: hypothetical protein A3J19_01210 [Candidatus Daviesbacteria bacterium RIFCSPLOWO2_02_FULL_41_8]OGZ39312.1 MAG: hypothetical protein A3E90_01305 [Candidatus Portnoybacteria bacterium RIFCSPHIGHO2_12_FULL_40_11]
MENLNLQLFGENSLEINPPEELNNTESLPKSPVPTPDPIKEFENVIATIFPTNQEENKLHKARGILGESARDYTDEELNYLVTDFEYLVDTWLDLFEKRVFQGKTLKELVGESANGNTK